MAKPKNPNHQPWWTRLHWPTVALAVGTLACIVATPVAFFALVPERMVDKLIHLPWSTILAVGAPALAAAVGVLRQAFMGPVVGPEPRPVPTVDPLAPVCESCGQPLPDDDGGGEP